MTEMQIRANDGTSLNAYHWPAERTTANIVIIHGYGHHGGSFAEVARRLNENGYGVFALDQRGHGKSPGRRGYIASFDNWVDDAGALIAQIEPQTSSAPLFLMGHSLGCLALGLYAIRNKPAVNGLIFSSGLLRIPDHVPVFLQKLAGILGTLTPTLPVQKVDANATSRDPLAVQALIDDPLRYGGMMQARSGAEVAKGIAAFQAGMKEITLPLLIMHGTADKLTDCEGSRQLYAQARSADKTLEIFENAYHEIYNDLEKERWYTHLLAWLNTHVC